MYCRLVTITTDNVIETNEFHSGVGAHWLSFPTPAFGAPLLGVAFLWMAMKLTACRSNLATRHLLQGSILYLPLLCALLLLAKEHSM